VTGTSNTPGARTGTSGYLDSTNNRFIIFGGRGYGVTTTSGKLNDLWSFEISSGNWRWISGDNAINSVAVVSTKPGGRYSHVRR
jgi:Galactose oxidase, central domain